MILIDTSVWVNHFRREHAGLAELLDDGQILNHPFVVGELAVGNLKNREGILNFFGDLPPATIASYEDVLTFIEAFSLYGRGLSYIDVHLLAAARLSDAHLWTVDKRLHAAAERLSIAARLD